jgi:hypothetical protein
MDAKRSTLAALELACNLVDRVAYRPVVIRLTQPLPRWWRCDLSRLSVWLDARWRVGYWDDRGPSGLCDICSRRTAWLRVGGSWEDMGVPNDADDFMLSHPLDLCFACSHAMPYGPIVSDEQLQSTLASTRARSVSWSWRWPDFE